MKQKSSTIQSIINQAKKGKMFILVDNKQRIRGVYNGTMPYEMTRLVEDIYYLKKLITN